jgi:ketosteroid isomerase-like protein
MERELVDAWVRGYLKAWESNDGEDIGALFSDEARYYTAPWRPPWEGRAGIVTGWLDRKDEAGQWEFTYETIAVADDLAVVRGRTIYRDEGNKAYANLWLIRLTEDGRCSEFTEWWMEEA